MTGRGDPGAGFVRRHKPEDIKVTLNLRTSASSTIVSLPDQDAKSTTVSDINIQIHASVKYSAHPALPVTLWTWRTPLERSLSPEDSSPVWIESALTYLQSTSNADRYGGPPELGYRICRRGGFARNLREKWDFLTIPALASGEEVVVEHKLPIEQLQFWKKRDDGYREEVQPEKGEKWRIGPSAGGLATFWWRWGDLEGDLKGKKFKNDEWYDERYDEDTGNKEEDGRSENEKWVESEGENGFGLTMEIENHVELTFE